MKAAICLCIACVCLYATGWTQDLPATELPSEDEVYEAFLAGEIDYDQFIQLLELIQDGLDSTNVHLLDLITETLLPRLDDRDAIDASSNPSRPPARMKYSYYQSMREPVQSRYSTSVSSKLGANWDIALKLHRNPGAPDHLTARSCTYRSDSGIIRQAQFGSFSKLLGLGTVFGHHSKLLHYDESIGPENLAFPDYGGQNGAYGQFALRQLVVEPILSLHRDSLHSLLSAGGSLTLTQHRVATSVIVGYSRLGNRRSDYALSDYKTALELTWRPGRNRWSAEYAIQTGYRNDFGTFVIDGDYRQSAFRLQMTAWIYGDQFLDLTGGSKTVSLSHTKRIPELGFSFSDKRSGQEGGLLRTTLNLAENVMWTNSLLAAARNRDTSTAQWLTGLEYRQSKSLTLSATVLCKESKRALNSNSERRLRAGLKYNRRNFSWRALAGHTSRTSGPGYFFWSNDFRITLSPSTQVQFSSNLGRIAKGSIDYWYLFLRTEHRLFDRTRFSTKLMHRYDRTASHRNQPAVGFEVTADL